MKKYTALTMSILSVFGLIWVLVVATKMKLSPSQGEVGLSGDSGFLKEGQALDQQLRSLSLSLSKLQSLDSSSGLLMSKTGPLLQMGAEVPENKSANTGASGMNVYQGNADSAAAVKKKEPVISMIYMSSDMKMVVINGRTLEVGGRLENGGRITEITMDAIEYDLAGKKHVLKAPGQQVLGSTVKLGN